MTVLLFATKLDRPVLRTPRRQDPALAEARRVLDRLALQWVEARPIHPRGLAALALLAEDARPPVGGPA